MRGTLFVVGSVACSLAIFACEDSSGGGGGDPFTSEGGAFEAGPEPDSSTTPADTGTDSPTPQPGVTVMLLRGTTGVAGADVVFHDTSGAVLETKQTGADGKANSTLGAVQASVLFGAVNQRHIITWTSAADGDTLVALDDTTDDPVGSIIATPQGSFADAGASGFGALVGNCSLASRTSPFTIPIQRSCTRAKEAVLAQATDANANLIGYAFAKAQALPPPDAGAATSALGPWLLPSTIGVIAQNTPTGDTFTISLTEIANDLPFPNQTGRPARLQTLPTAFSVAPGFADAYQIGVSVGSGTTLGAVHGFGARIAPAASTTVPYVSALPVIDSVTLASTDITRPQLDWTTAGNVSLATADGGVVMLTWFDRLENIGTWSFVVPPGSKGVTAPAMPPALATSLPHGQMGTTPPSTFDTPSVTFAESDAIADYGAFRAAVGVALPLDATPTSSPLPVVPVNGKYELTSFKAIGR